jgi:DNA ligase-associated metallophosphoesterase
MTAVIPIFVAGEAIELHADRALFWPARRRLVIADLHLGKGDLFRRAGIAVPSGGTGDDLARIAALLAHTGATSLWVLGDFLHGDPAPARWREGWERFRTAHAALEIVVVAGNHDRALRGAGLAIDIEDGPRRDGPFEFRHAPAAAADAYVLCGHLHPVVRLPGLRRRFPAFVFDPGTGVLPAFSLFAGGWSVEPAAQRRRFACFDAGIVEFVTPA